MAENVRGNINVTTTRQFIIKKDLHLPRFPTKKTAIVQINSLAESGEILLGLGESQFCNTIKSVDPINLTEIDLNVWSRKVSIDDLCQYTLHKHSKYLRAQPTTYYLGLLREEIVSCVISHCLVWRRRVL